MLSNRFKAGVFACGSTSFRGYWSKTSYKGYRELACRERFPDFKESEWWYSTYFIESIKRRL